MLQLPLSEAYDGIFGAETLVSLGYSALARTPYSGSETRIRTQQEEDMNLFGPQGFSRQKLVLERCIGFEPMKNDVGNVAP